MASFPKLSSGSMFVLSDISDNAIMMYPTNLEYAWKNRVVRFLNDTEQAWTVRPPMFGAKVQFKDMNGYDTSLIRDFFISQKGKYVDTALTNLFDITVAGTTYPNMAFDQDEFPVTVDSGELISFELKVRQLISSFLGGGPGGAPPTSSMEFHVLSSAAFASYDPGFLFRSSIAGFTVPFGGGAGPWTLQDDTTTRSPGPSVVYGTAVAAYIDGTLPGSGLCTLDIYNIYAIVTYPDGTVFTVKPTQMQIIPGTGEDSAIVNPANAYDGDLSTFARITRSSFAPLQTTAIFQFIF